MKKLLFIAVLLLIYPIFSKADTAPTPFDISICNAFDNNAFDYNILPLGSCYRYYWWLTVASYVHTFWVPEVFISVFDNATNSHFAAYPVGLRQIAKEQKAANLVATHFGRQKLTPPGITTSKFDEDGVGEFFLNAHVGPVFFAQEFFDQLSSDYNPSIVPEHGYDGKCIQYSTIVDDEQWRFGTADKNFSNSTYLTLLGGAGGLALSASKIKDISGFICGMAKTLNGNLECEGSITNVGSIASSIASSNPIVGCSTFGVSMVPAMSIPFYSSPLASLDALFSTESNAGWACTPKVNLLPITIPNTYCYDRHMIFPRTGHVRAQTWFEAAYITAVKASHLASVTIRYPAFTSSMKLCSIDGTLCYPYDTPSRLVTIKERDKKPMGTTNRVGYVLWTQKYHCAQTRKPRYMYVDPKLASFCAATQPSLMASEMGK